ncbi:hypothetical protein [Methylicorpusculum sp.]|uniref:hypothetical protein n=1 Tax=Methylicorpusculum sp. TaxID=2713644 RepID=UPI0027315D0F|nr:hypothetical protein [Methylicorpusculum sp.]MDP2176992.1 hypothetical protein [Methylicorpusculum sp.]MDP3527809.1 hypothetical protein [Methylicorpusculum sp.]
MIKSADEWLTMRNLRNQMVHEYVEDPVILNNALQSGHGSNSQFNIFRVSLGWGKAFRGTP